MMSKPKNTPKPTQARINFPLDARLRDRISKHAKLKGMTTRGLIRVLLIEWLDRQIV
jgi:hypothetical protein